MQLDTAFCRFAIPRHNNPQINVDRKSRNDRNKECSLRSWNCKIDIVEKTARAEMHVYTYSDDSRILVLIQLDILDLARIHSDLMLCVLL